MPPVLLQPSLVPAASLPVSGQQAIQLGGKSGEAFVAEIHDRYYQQTLAGNMFFASGPVAGIAVPIFSTTTHTFGLWNPLGSGKNLVLVELNIGGIVAPIVLSEFCLTFLPLLGAQIGTASPIPTGTYGTATNCLVGSGIVPVGRYLSAATLTTAGTFIQTYPLGVTVTSVTAAYSMALISYQFNGKFVLAPGSAVFLTAAIAQTSGTVPVLSWYEMPT